MINEKEVTRISKFLSLVLRHKPDTIGIELDENGWTDVSTLIEKTNQANVHLDFNMLKHVVDTNSKKRFAFNETFDRIRTNQGHSVEIELAYPPQQPPGILYHGTGEKSLGSILETGIQKQQRHHVHLSADMETAAMVGQRHGKPVVLVIDAAKMYEDNYLFYLSNNGVWLTDFVPAKYLKNHGL